jgi:DNA-binding response OmpR family regulator
VAVEAMKLGAVDFLQKPFNPGEVRDMVSRILQEAPEQPARKYEYYLGLARQSINAGELAAARVYAKKAIFINPNRPQAFNILGGLAEARGDRLEGQQNYRIALELDPTYDPARKNLERVTNLPYTQMGIVWG